MSGLSYTARHPATAYSSVAASQVIFQLTTGATVSATIKKIELQSSAVTSGQAIYGIQWGYYATGTAGGSTTTPAPVVKRNSVAAAAAFRYASSTLGTTFTVVDEYQWNIALPFEVTNGLSQTEIEVPANTAWALLLTTQSVTPTFSGKLTFEER